MITCVLSATVEMPEGIDGGPIPALLELFASALADMGMMVTAVQVETIDYPRD